jgi:hypothetical protein
MSLLPFKVTLQDRALSPTEQDWIWQRVATVYVPNRRDEYRVYAPAKASGDALEWVDHFVVREVRSGGEYDVMDGYRDMVIKAVKAELERTEGFETRPLGDGVHYVAHICSQGHVLSAGRLVFPPGEHCSRCGSAIIQTCQDCKTPIRGIHLQAAIHTYQRPSFCHKCGRPYPWMKDTMDTARELLYHDDKLTLEERSKLWDLLQYVMSDPKSDLVPAKRKLIDINLARAAAVTRDALTDLLAKYLAEISKG